jgi:hypothetical protein
MKRCVLSVVALLVAVTPAFGQTAAPVNGSGLWRNVSFAPVSSSATTETASVSRSTAPQGAQERHGFTILVNLGVGIQHDTGFGESAVGWGGANVGIGGFVNNKLAILGRFSGTTVTYDSFGKQVSGVMGGTVQYWLSDLFHVEAGGGIGFWNWNFDSEIGTGLIFGAGVTVLDRGRHNLQVGAEYAPVFTDTSTVHNFCITFGYQFHK